MNVISITNQHIDRSNTASIQKTAIEIHSFGGLSVCINGQCVRAQEWKSPKMYQLLLAIVVLGGRNVSVSDIGDMLWPDSDGDKAMQNLEFMLRRLRQTLKSHLGDQLRSKQSIILHNSKISLNADIFSLDTWQWERFKSEAQKLRNRQQYEAALALEQQAASLITGAFLQGDNDRGIMQREVWHSRMCNWIHTTVNIWMQDEAIAHEQIIDLLDRGLLINPCSEKLCMQRISILFRAGYKVDAMRAYRSWAMLIKESLGMNPPDPFGSRYTSHSKPQHWLYSPVSNSNS